MVNYRNSDAMKEYYRDKFPTDDEGSVWGAGEFAGRWGALKHQAALHQKSVDESDLDEAEKTRLAITIPKRGQTDTAIADLPTSRSSTSRPRS